MPTNHKRYDFKTIAELHAIPADKIALFCAGLGMWLAIARETADLPGVTMTNLDTFGWIDDGAHDVNLTIRVVPE